MGMATGVRICARDCARQDAAETEDARSVEFMVFAEGKEGMDRVEVCCTTVEVMHLLNALPSR